MTDKVKKKNVQLTLSNTTWAQPLKFVDKSK